MQFSNISKSIGLWIAVFCVSLLVGYSIMAWTEPGGTPPNNNVSAPINTGDTWQTKSGGFTSAKLSVDDGSGACCAGYYTASINEAGANQPTLQFHDSGVAEGQMILQNDIANGQRGFLFQSTQTTMGGRFTGNVVANGELQSTLTSGYGQLRMVAGDYGAFWRNDGSNTYFLLTNAGNQYGVWNDLRPLYINNVSGAVSVGTQLCLGGACRSNWPGAQSCPTGQAMTGMDASGNIICSGSGFNPFSYPCNQTLPSGAKKIFITSNLYNAYDTTTEVAADAKCQAAANAVGFSGTYKALMYAGSRNINNVFPSGQSFWNGQLNGTSCQWNLVAYNMADFFTDEGGGVYLRNPILYNEQGLSMSGVGVWTSFRPSGAGNYELLSHGTMTCHGSHASSLCVDTWKGGCYYRGTASPPNSSCSYYKESSHWYGLAQQTNNQWAYNSWCTSANGYSNAAWDNCFNNMRALYCVEQ